MAPLNYRSLGASREPVPPEQMEEAYGCFPAVFSGVLGGAGCVATAWTHAPSRGVDVLAGIVVAGCLIGAWLAAIACLRHPRGAAVGILSLVAVTAMTGLAGTAILFHR